MVTKLNFQKRHVLQKPILYFEKPKFDQFIKYLFVKGLPGKEILAKITDQCPS